MDLSPFEGALCKVTLNDGREFIGRVILSPGKGMCIASADMPWTFAEDVLSVTILPKETPS